MMGLETATSISALNALWPLGSDPRSQGDDHLRLIKSVLKADALPKSGGDLTGALVVTNGASLRLADGASLSAEDAGGNYRLALRAQSGDLQLGNPAGQFAAQTFEGDWTFDSPPTLPASGTQGAPQLRFGAGSPASGLYYDGTANFGLTVAGAVKFFFRSTGATAGIDVLTKGAGDGLYQPKSSSRRFKEDIGPAAPVELSRIERRSWRWGGELPEDDPRRGTRGSGLVAEEVQAIAPEAVTHDAEGRVTGLDALTLIGVLWERVAALEASGDGAAA